MTEIPPNIHAAFIGAAIWHGNADEADELLIKYPQLNSGDIFTASILGDEGSVAHYLAQDHKNATATAEPFGGTALVYLCLSKYLRLKKRPEAGFIKAAEMLIDAGADPSSGFWNKGEFETALYGAAGVIQHAGLSQLLVDRGAEVNDEEVCYHSPETWDNDAMKVVLNIRGCTQSYWTRRRSPDAVAALLKAGASIAGIPFPCGYAAIDDLLKNSDDQTT